MTNLLIKANLDFLVCSPFNQSARHLPNNQFKCSTIEDTSISNVLHWTQHSRMDITFIQHVLLQISLWDTFSNSAMAIQIAHWSLKVTVQCFLFLRWNVSLRCGGTPCSSFNTVIPNKMATSLQQFPPTVTVEPPLILRAKKIKTGAFHNGFGRWIVCFSFCRDDYDDFTW